jgi:hypothetical protein
MEVHGALSPTVLLPEMNRRIGFDFDENGGFFQMLERLEGKCVITPADSSPDRTTGHNECKALHDGFSLALFVGEECRENSCGAK